MSQVGLSFVNIGKQQQTGLLHQLTVSGELLVTGSRNIWLTQSKTHNCFTVSIHFMLPNTYNILSHC